MNAYEVLKLLHPIKTTPKAGANVHELVKTKFPKEYISLFLSDFDWNDLDGILDYLYGERELGFFGVPKSNINEIINLIENSCEVK